MNNKTRNNTYANIYSYNKLYEITNTFYPTKENKFKYDLQYVSPYVLQGGDASGSVWTNPKVYDIAKEDPGISWVL